MPTLRKEDGAEALVQLMVKADGRTAMDELASYREAWFYQRRIRGQFDTAAVFGLFRTYSSPQGLLKIEAQAAEAMRDTPKEYRLGLAALLLHVARSDGAVSGQELDLLRRVGARLGLAAAEVLAEYRSAYQSGSLAPQDQARGEDQRPAGPLRRLGKAEALDLLCRLVARADGQARDETVKAYKEAPFYRKFVTGQVDRAGLKALACRYSSPHGQRTLEELAVAALKGCFDNVKRSAAALLLHAARADGGVSGNEMELLARVVTGLGVDRREALAAYREEYGL